MNQSTNDGTLQLHADGQLLVEFTNAGEIRTGPAFKDDTAANLVLRMLAAQFPTWQGGFIAAFLRFQKPAVDSRALLRGVLGGAPVANEVSDRLWSAVVEQLAVRAEEA